MLNFEQTMEEALEIFTDLKRKDDHTTALNTILLKTNSNKSIQKLLEDLGPYITTGTAVKRQRGMLVLARVIERLPSLPLNISSMNHLITFLSQRLADYVCEGEVLLTICFLFKYHKELFTIEHIKTLMNEMGQRVQNLQGQSQEIRQQIYELLLAWLQDETYRNVCVQGLSNEGLFISTFVRFMDGEKDPRNLMLCFVLFKHICYLFTDQQIQNHIEELFDVISVYYPIDFTPPSNDIHGITSDHLRDALGECFKSHPLLSSYVLPLVLEKLQEPENEKQHFDMLKCLKECLQSYGLNIIQSYIRQLYELMKSQILFGNFSDENMYILEECLQIMQVIMQLICNQKDNLEKENKFDSMDKSKIIDINKEDEKLWIENVNIIGWTSFVEPLLIDSENELKIPDAKMARLFGKIIAACATCHSIAFRCMMKRLWKLIFSKCNQKDNIGDSQTEAIVELLTNMWVQLHDLLMQESFSTEQVLLMKPHTDPMLDFFIHIIDHDLMSIDMKSMAIVAVSSVLDVKWRILSDEQVKKLVELLYKEYCQYFTIGINSNKNIDVAMKDVHERVVKEVFEPIKLEQMKEIIFGALSKIGAINSNWLLNAYVIKLWNYTKQDQTGDGLITFMEGVIPIILIDKDIFNHVLQQICIPLYQNSNIRGLQMIAGLCDTLCESKKFRDYMSDETSQLWINTWLFQNILTSEEENSKKKESIVLDQKLRVAHMISRIVASSRDELTTKIALDLINKQKDITKSLQDCVLFLSVIASLSPLVLDRCKINLQWVQNMQERMLLNDSNYNGNLDVCLQCLATIVNKSDVQSLINPLVDQYLIPTLQKMVESQWYSHKDLKYSIWLIKALAMRCYANDKAMQQIYQYLCHLLRLETKNQRFAHIAANGFEIIMQDSRFILNKSTHCKISPFYRQKFFDEILKLILPTIEKGSGDEKNNENNNNIYPLLALSHLLRHVPSAIIGNYLQKLLPPIVQSLTCDLISLQISTLFCFEILLLNNLTSDEKGIDMEEANNTVKKCKEWIETHANAIIPALVHLSGYKENESVRKSALNCLTCMTKLSHRVLSPFKFEVIRDLAKCLDDEKKNVRKLAVQCRNEWFMIST